MSDTAYWEAMTTAQQQCFIRLVLDVIQAPCTCMEKRRCNACDRKIRIEVAFPVTHRACTKSLHPSWPEENA